jgi:inositol phosphorylceramide synthase catalytic subunit
MKESSLNTENKEKIPLITVESLLKSTTSRFLSVKEGIWLAIGTVLYFSWFYFLMGLRPEHTALYFVLLGLYFTHSKTRQFLWAFGVYAVYWIMYDSLRIVPNYTVNTVHITDLYNFEKSIFGIFTEGGILTPNEFFKENHTPLGDVLSAFFYINWMPIPLIFSFWLFLKNKPLLITFAYTFCFVNLLGFIIYYAYPAAPPWYMEQYGAEILENAPPSAAGLLNFDKLFGVQFFLNLYQKNSNVFAAMPSMHSAFPVVCFLCGLRLKKTWLNILFGIFALGIWVSAIYTRHHYITDVVVGILVAVIGFYGFQYLSEKTKLKNFFDFLSTKF